MLLLANAAARTPDAKRLHPFGRLLPATAQRDRLNRRPPPLVLLGRRPKRSHSALAMAPDPKRRVDRAERPGTMQHLQQGTQPRLLAARVVPDRHASSLQDPQRTTTVPPKTDR